MDIRITRNKHFVSKSLFIFNTLILYKPKLDITVSKMSHIDSKKKKKSFHIVQNRNVMNPIISTEKTLRLPIYDNLKLGIEELIDSIGF